MILADYGWCCYSVDSIAIAVTAYLSKVIIGTGEEQTFPACTRYGCTNFFSAG